MCVCVCGGGGGVGLRGCRCVDEENVYREETEAVQEGQGRC